MQTGIWGFGGSGCFGAPEELWSAFNTTILDVVGGYLGTHYQAKKNVVYQGILDALCGSQRDQLNGRAELSGS